MTTQTPQATQRYIDDGRRNLTLLDTRPSHA
jgi:hypothetical protein